MYTTGRVEIIPHSSRSVSTSVQRIYTLRVSSIKPHSSPAEVTTQSFWLGRCTNSKSVKKRQVMLKPVASMVTLPDPGLGSKTSYNVPPYTVSGNRPPPKCRPRVSLHIRKHTSLKSLLFPQLRAYNTPAPLSVYCPHYRLENFAFPPTSTCRTLGCPLRVHHSVAHGGFDAASPAILFGSYARFITFFPVPCII